MLILAKKINFQSAIIGVNLRFNRIAVGLNKATL